MIEFTRVGVSHLYPYAEMARKERVVLSDSTMYYGGYVDGVLVGFYGLRIRGGVAYIKNDYTFGAFRRTGYLAESIKFRMRVVKNLEIKRVRANCTKLALGTHLKLGAHIIAQYKRGDALVEYTENTIKALSNA